MKVLVTGANGFLGRRIVRRFWEAGHQVRAMVRPGARCRLDTEVCEADVCDDAAVAAAVTGTDCVVHAAARVSTGGSWEEFAEVNVRGTLRVIRAAQAAGAARIVHISSLGVYAVPYDGARITEDSPYESESEARGHYGRSKLAADRLALHAAGRGAPVVVLRPGLLYGPGKRPPLARQSFSVGGWRLILATRRYELPMTHVDSVADAALLAAAALAAVGHAFTIVDANVPQAEYARLYRAAAGERWRSVFLPVGAVAAAAWVLERGLRLARRRSPVTYHQVRRATRGAHYDCTRAAQVLGWQPAIGVAQGLEATFASLRVPPPGAGVAGVASVPS